MLCEWEQPHTWSTSLVGSHHDGWLFQNVRQPYRSLSSLFPPHIHQHIETTWEEHSLNGELECDLAHDDTFIWFDEQCPIRDREWTKSIDVMIEWSDRHLIDWGQGPQSLLMPWPPSIQNTNSSPTASIHHQMIQWLGYAKQVCQKQNLSPNETFHHPLCFGSSNLRFTHGVNPLLICKCLASTSGVYFIITSCFEDTGTHFWDSPPSGLLRIITLKSKWKLSFAVM